MLAAHLLGVGPDGALQGQGGVTGAQGVILVGNGRPEQGHNAVAKHLVHRALITVHGVHHDMDGRVQSCWAASGSQALDELVESLMSAKKTVTCLRSPSRVFLAVRIFSARCGGV